MAFQLSPGINITEKDLTTVVPAVSTSKGAIAGEFRWGPVDEVVTVDTENNLKKIFGEPDDNTYRYWLTAASFLAYANNLQVVRAMEATAANATADGSGVAGTNAITNYDKYVESYESGAGAVGLWAAKYPGALGNSLAVSYCYGGTAYRETLTDVHTANAAAAATSFAVSAGNGDEFVIGDIIRFVVTSTGLLHHSTEYQITNVATDTLTIVEVGKTTGLTEGVDGSGTALSIERRWKYADDFLGAPGTSQHATDVGSANDELHIVVVDEDGQWTGTADTVLERFPFLSVASDAKTSEGASNYYRTVLRDQSQYVWWMDHPTQASNWGTTLNASLGAAYTWSSGDLKAINDGLTADASLSGGLDGGRVTSSELTATDKGYDLFTDADTTDVNLVIAGPAGDQATLGTGQDDDVSTVHQWLVDNLVEVRKDCVVFISPPASCTVDVATQSAQDANIREYVTGAAVSGGTNTYTSNNLNRSTSYAVVDTGQKHMYDRYNDTMRWVPLNGDIAGLCARTDQLTDPWFSPAGYNRGAIKNAAKLAFNPRKAFRDNLYQEGVNPVISEPGSGILLLGDKTHLDKPSAFDRINVRRLFIVLEKAISTAAKFSLFEFNDEFTRANFVALVEPFLRDVQGRRGIQQFKVVCDESNNTAEVIDRNEFVGDIYIKPARSINYISLNFIATRTGVDFSEVGG
jgi:hypothetical protein